MGASAFYARARGGVVTRKRLWALVLVAVLAAAGWRLSRTAECIARFGSDRARAELCRSLPLLNPARQSALYLRLLADPAEEVRLACMTACERGAASPEVDDALMAVLADASAAGLERTRAGQVLLGRAPVREDVNAFLEAHAREDAFRRACPRLAVRVLARTFDRATLEERQGLVLASLDARDPLADALQPLLLEHAGLCAPWREHFSEAQEEEGVPPGIQQFCANMTAKLEAREAAAKDGPSEPPPEDSSEPYSVWEAAWAQGLRPNYQIAEAHGRTCLTLLEGAGGVMSWLKGEDGTVDVGEARFSLWASREGAYDLWARVWFDDKCGNSFGVWLDEAQFGNFSDGEDVMQAWHWLRLTSGGGVALKRGFHAGRLQAWEDGVCIEKLALLPAGHDPNRQEPKARPLWDASVPSSLSLSMPYQSQMRGTTQAVTVYVRRSTPALTEGAVHLKVPAPFAVEDGVCDQVVRFEKDSPVASATFKIVLPQDAVAGEGVLRASYTDVTGARVRGQAILGAQFDWRTTGPVETSGPQAEKLNAATSVSDADLAGWTRFPMKGLDGYRRLNFEYAYGTLRDKYVYLCTEIEVTKEGDYLALLTADDTAAVFLGGQRLIEQPGGGPGEGRLVMETVHLKEGRHRIFARVYQNGLENPEGEDKYRHTWNHWNLKLLLRRQRHEPAAEIRGVPWAEPAK
ncbi:MAG: hypothetical protein KIS92_13590 [Planctomycetota bacterium]|nr:hypothetical protein [Planctomycetota bacterium]